MKKITHEMALITIEIMKYTKAFGEVLKTCLENIMATPSYLTEEVKNTDGARDTTFLSHSLLRVQICNWIRFCQLQIS